MTKTIEVSDETFDKIKDQLTDGEVKEIDSLGDLIGETYLFQCARYIYHGEVKSITTDYIELKNASVVFDTGDYENSDASDKQKVPKNKIHVMRQSIEAFYKLLW